MPDLQKRHNIEGQQSGGYVTPNRFWLVLLLILALLFGVAFSEVLTRGKMTPYFDGGWLTYMVHELILIIKTYVSDIMAMLYDAVNSLRL